MNVSLIFPPSWHPSQPYLSLPSLTGFLNQGGVQNVKQRDLNIEVLDTILTESYGREIHAKLQDKVRQLERTKQSETGPSSEEHYARAVESLERFPYLFDRVEVAKEILRGEEFYDIERYRDALFLIDKWNLLPYTFWDMAPGLLIVFGLMKVAEALAPTDGHLGGMAAGSQPNPGQPGGGQPGMGQ